MSQTFSGLAVALATPFDARGEVDLPAFRRLVRHVARGGADTLVVLGSTGEAATLLENERDALIVACREEAGEKNVVAGVGHNATRQTALWAKRAQELGCHGALVVTPYYNKPTANGVVQHFRAAAEAAPDLAIIAYNVPGRTGLNMSPALVRKLWEIPQIVALKESSGNLSQIVEIASQLPAGKTLLAGDDNLAAASIAVGADGLVSVIGNVLPAETKALVEAARRGERARARDLTNRLLVLMDALFVESNPIPLKAALAILGIAEDHLRLPLTRPEAATREKVRAALVTARGAHAEGVAYGC